MKQNLILVAALGFLSLAPSPTRAAGVLDHAPRYAGSIELRAPVWSGVTASGESNWRNVELAGDLRIWNVLGPFVLRVQGEHTFHQAGIFSPENKLKVGVELPLGHQLTAFSYWDRRFNQGVDRVFAGLRLGFGGNL